MKCPYCGHLLPADRLDSVPRDTPDKVENVTWDGNPHSVVSTIYPDEWVHYKYYKDYFKGREKGDVAE